MHRVDQIAPNHTLNQIIAICFTDRFRKHGPAIAHDSDLLTMIKYFIQMMGNKDDRYPRAFN